MKITPSSISTASNSTKVASKKSPNMPQTIKLDEATISNCIKYPENNYSDIFAYSVSVDDIVENGLGKDTNEIYSNIKPSDPKARTDGYDMDVTDKFTQSAEKYDALVKQINEKYGDDERQKGIELFTLQNAFLKHNRSILDHETIYNSIGILNISLEDSRTLADKFSDDFISSYNSNESKSSIAQKTKDLLNSSFPSETTSFSSISYKDFELFSKTREGFYNKGTGIDILNSLAQNQDLSEVLRNQYEKLSKADNIYGLTFK